MPSPLPPRIDFADDTSFAAFTLRERLPHVVDRVRALPHWTSTSQRKLAALRDSLPDGAPPELLGTNTAEQAFWQAYLEPHRGSRWRELAFLDAEFVFYRALLDAVDFGCDGTRDPFAEIKLASLDDPAPNLPRAAQQLAAIDDWTLEAARGALHAALTGNTADLSQLGGASGAPSPPLVDDTAAFFQDVPAESPASLELALDNAGEELIGDLVLVDYLLRVLPGLRLRVHVKRLPMFVSDATAHDWRAALDRLCGDMTTAVADWGRRLVGYEQAGRLVLCDDPFWSRPLSFRELPSELHAALAGSRALILKGDLNYRRYVEDRRWPYDSPAAAHRIASLPPTLALRVLKSELAVGVPPAVLSQLQGAEPDWLYDGHHSVVQYFR